MFSEDIAKTQHSGEFQLYSEQIQLKIYVNGLDVETLKPGLSCRKTTKIQNLILIYTIHLNVCKDYQVSNTSIHDQA